VNRSIAQVVRELCLSYPESEEVKPRGSPDFRAQGKSFAIFVVNHHGDERVALWLHSPAGVQRLYTEINPDVYFVPPYVGPRGWLGVELNKGLAWEEIARRVWEAFQNAVPAALANSVSEPIHVEPPNLEMTAEQINPMLAAHPQMVLDQLAERCDRLPETSAGKQFGSPVWKAGKKTFVCVHHRAGRLQLQFWVGVEQQSLFTPDERYSIPKYMGHNGWIDLDVEKRINWDEVESLLNTSYRHFALKRMLGKLDSGLD